MNPKAEKLALFRYGLIAPLVIEPLARGELTRRAEERHGIRLESGDVVLVGDTPLDVAAALEGGARAVGVATGPYDEHALAAAGAHGVLTDLSNADAVIRAVLA